MQEGFLQHVISQRKPKLNIGKIAKLKEEPEEELGCGTLSNRHRGRHPKESWHLFKNK